MGGLAFGKMLQKVVEPKRERERETERKRTKALCRAFLDDMNLHSLILLKFFVVIAVFDASSAKFVLVVVVLLKIHQFVDFR